MHLSNLKKASICVTLLLISACAPAEKPFTSIKVGKPYVINGKTYIPKSNAYYDKIGEASWYGPGFDGNKTANGEIFDQDDITAAHPTLPMPSLVRVTNLSNNKSLIVRVNDRGPFHNNRIIDLSKRSAEIIGIKGVKTVRVRFLDRETREYIASIKGISPKIDMVAYNKFYNKRSNQERRNSTSRNFNNAVESFAPVQSVASSDLETPAKSTLTKIDLDNVEEPPARLFKSKIISNNKPSAIPQKTSSIDLSKNRYIILAGSFSSENNANKLADSLNSIPKHRNLVLVDEVEINNKQWWRVHVGPFNDKDKAKESLQIVQNKGVSDARIRRQ